MMEEDFYATIKLKTGEELFAKVVVEQNDNLLLLNNPIVINKFKSRNGIEGYKIEPWLKTTTEDLFLLSMKDVLTISESKNVEMIYLHQQYTKENSTKNTLKNTKDKVSRKMGYISNVSEAKKFLENIYKNS